MLSEKEKESIVERIRFETETRKQMLTSSESTKYSWLNSKFFLLLLGSLITGILVPWFQLTYKAIEWRRQNQFDNISFRLEKMRDCLREFVYVATYTAEGTERLEPFIDIGPLSLKEYEEFEEQYVDLQNRRYKQNAKAVSLIFYSRDANSLRKLFNNYVSKSSEYLLDIRKSVKSRHKGDARNLDALRSKIKGYSLVLNDCYRQVIDRINHEIRSTEDESEEFSL